jgi:hypothetical protein
MEEISANDVEGEVLNNILFLVNILYTRKKEK